jgi:hypothetical protein
VAGCERKSQGVVNARDVEYRMTMAAPLLRLGAGAHQAPKIVEIP